MTESELLDLGDANLAEANREFARWHPESEIVECDDLLLCAGVTPFPAGNFNSVMRLAPEPVPPASEVLETARAFFNERKRGFTVFARAHRDADLEAACVEAKLTVISDTPGMVVEEPIAESETPAGITLRRVDDAASARDFADAAARSYHTMGLPLEVTAQALETAERILRPHTTTVVAYRDGAPLACAQVILSHGIGGVYWVGTVPDGRRMGLGDLCTRDVTNAAFRAGAQAVVLQASPQGEPIYRRMGYREVTRYRWYVAFEPS